MKLCFHMGHTLKTRRFGVKRAVHALPMFLLLPLWAQTSPGAAGISSQSLTDLAPTLHGAGIADIEFGRALQGGTLTVQPGRIRFGNEVCLGFTSALTASISSGTGGGAAKLYVSDSCAVVLEYPNALKLAFALKGITAAAVALPGVPATGVYLADIGIEGGRITSLVDKRAVYSAFSAVAGQGIVVECTSGPCLFSIDPATVATLGGNRVTTGVDDNRNATRTFPAREAAADPPQCTPGEQYFNNRTGVRKDCIAPNTWAAPGGGGGSTVTSLEEKVDVQAGFTTASTVADTTIVTTPIAALAAGACVRWTWTGWVVGSAVEAKIVFGAVTLPIPAAFDSDHAAVSGLVCNNRGVQDQQLLSATTSRATVHATAAIDTKSTRTLALVVRGEGSVTTQLWTVSRIAR